MTLVFFDAPLAGRSLVVPKRNGAMRLMACALLMFFIFPIGCTKAYVTPQPPPTGEEIAAEVSPEGWNLSAESETFYYYILLSEALRERNVPVVREALRGMLNVSPSLEVFRDSAAILLAFEQYDAAHTASIEGLRRFPGDGTLMQILAEVYRATGNPREGIRVLETYLKDSPKDYSVMEELVRCNILAGDIDSAHKYLSQIPQAQRTQDSIIFEAFIIESRGELGKAKAMLQKALRQDPDFGLALAELARINEKMNLPQEAIAAYHELLEVSGFSPASREYMQLVLQILRLQLEEGQQQEALQTVAAGPQTALFFLEAAVRFSKAGLYGEAERLLLLARDHGIGPEETALNLSLLRLQATKDPLAALPPLEVVAPAHPLYEEAVLRKVQLLAEALKLPEAADAAAQGRKKKPEAKSLWLMEAQLRSRLGEHDEALRVAQKAERAFPEDELVLYTLGLVQDGGGDKAGALQTMERLIRLYPGNAQGLNYVGYTLAEENRDLERALSLIGAALEINPTSYYIVDSFAWALYRLGRYDDAWKNILLCVEMGANEPVVWEHYAEIALALGKTAEARSGFEKAISLEPENAAELKDRLTTLP